MLRATNNVQFSISVIRIITESKFALQVVLLLFSNLSIRIVNKSVGLNRAQFYRNMPTKWKT